MELNTKWLMNICSVILIVASFSSACATDYVRGYKANPTEILAPPNAADWKSLERFSGTLSCEEFQFRLQSIFDPTGAIYPFLEVSDQFVKIYSDKNKKNPPLAEVAFAINEHRRPSPTHFRSPSEIKNVVTPAGKPLAGLRIVIDPADIGGKWAMMENRAQTYKGFGEIREGDLNLIVAKILTAKLEMLGAQVFLTHHTSEPVSGLNPEDLIPYATTLLEEHPKLLPKAFFDRARGISRKNPKAIQIAAEVLLTKTVEARARAEKVQKIFHPDITLVLQHNATSKSRRGALARINRNVFFINGAYTRRELTEDPHQRLKMLDKLFANVTPIEMIVADHISNHFVSKTGFPPVRYGNSAITRSTAMGNPYVVARNLALNREHAGPVVVTEPYFMNEAVTLRRLVEGDYEGVRLISGELRPSIYKEYAEAVVLGLLDAYGYRIQVAPSPPSDTGLLKSQDLALPSLKQNSIISRQEMLVPSLSSPFKPYQKNTLVPFIRPVVLSKKLESFLFRNSPLGSSTNNRELTTEKQEPTTKN